MMEEGKAFFDIWMYEVSDEIQNLATAFGERFMLEEAIAAMHAMDNENAKVVLAKTIYLHSLWNVKMNIGWYTMHKVVSNEAALELDSLFNQAVKDVVPHMNTLVEALGVSREKHLNAPIARDYVAFNAQLDNENFAEAGELFDFTKTGLPKL